MIGFRRPRCAQAVQASDVSLVLIEVHEISIVTIIPILGIEQRDLLSTQHIDHCGDGRVAADELR